MSNFTFRGKRSLGVRLWHWLDSVVIFGLLATVFLRSELVGVREHVKFIQDTLGAAVTPEQAKTIARSYFDRLWSWHVNLGLILGGLLLLRAAAEFFVEPGTALCMKIKSSLSTAKTDASARAFAAVKLSHAAFYAVLAGLVATGIVLTYGKSWGVPDPIRHALREVHQVSMYIVIAFIVLHIAGVVHAEKTTDPGLVSDMINGG